MMLSVTLGRMELLLVTSSTSILFNHANFKLVGVSLFLK